MGLVNTLAAYTIVCATAMGAARRAKWISVHPENVRNAIARKVCHLSSIVACCITLDTTNNRFLRTQSMRLRDCSLAEFWLCQTCEPYVTGYVMMCGTVCRLFEKFIWLGDVVPEKVPTCVCFKTTTRIRIIESNLASFVSIRRCTSTSSQILKII